MLSPENRIRLGFWGAAVIGIAFGAGSIASQMLVDTTSDLAFRDASQLTAVERFRATLEQEGRSARSHMLTGGERFQVDFERRVVQVNAELNDLRASLTDVEEQRLLERVDRAHEAYRAALRRTMQLRATADDVAVRGAFEEEVSPRRDELDSALHSLTELQERELAAATEAARGTVSRSYRWLTAFGAIFAAVAAFLGWQLGRAVRTLRRQREELAGFATRMERINQDLDAFAGRIAHDLKNALSPIPVTTRLLRNGPPPERQSQLVDRIDRSLERSLAMMDGLLAFSRSTAAPGASSSVVAALDDALDQLTPLRAKVDATLETEVEDGMVACSRELCSVILLNLIGNALKFMAGRPERKVEGRIHFDGAFCKMVVGDTGPGIPPSALSKIFDPFYRVPSTVAPGSGIGLATVARIVGAHHGTVEVRSTVGVGSTFCVRLPMARKATSEHPAPPSGVVHRLDAPLRSAR